MSESELAAALDNLLRAVEEEANKKTLPALVMLRLTPAMERGWAALSRTGE